MKAFEMKRYYTLALDPIHVGTGGYRIGRVDNTIVRDPATGIPKIPGTTIEGVCRSYAFLKAKEDNQNILLACAKGKPKGDEEENQPCGTCPICITFGFSRRDKSIQAMALFSDARILFFPVATMIGPVWVTCPMILKDAGLDVPHHLKNNEFVASESLKNILPEREGKKILNFGWLLLEGNVNVKEINLPSSGIPAEILSRIVIVPDNLFPTIVNSNLEVRTSVAIDPERGAAEEGALFTYEAIPRGTVFWFDVVYQNPKAFPLLNGVKISWKNKDGSDLEVEIKESTNDEDLFDILIKVVNDGLMYFEYLGVGGMGSRGFGRMKVLNIGEKNDGNNEGTKS